MVLTCTPSCLPRSASALVNAAHAALTELPIVKLAWGLRPLVPAIVMREPWRSFKRWPCRSGKPNMGEEFQSKTVLPVGIAQCREVPTPRCTGIVDQNIQAAKLAPNRLYECSRGVHLTQVKRDHDGLDISGAYGRGDLVERPFVLPVTTTPQPSSARANAMPRPMPRLDPVMRATFPARPSSIPAPLTGSAQ